MAARRLRPTPESRERGANTTFERVVSLAADAIVAIDKKHRVTVYNGAAEETFGWSREEVLGHPLEILLPERLRELHRKHMLDFTRGAVAARQMRAHRSEVTALRKNGEEFPAEVAYSRLDDRGELVMVILRDITQRKRLEREQQFLIEVGAALVETLDYEETLTCIARLAVRDMADCCIVDVVEEGRVRRLRVMHRDPSKTALAESLQRIPLDRARPHLFKTVLDTGQVTLVERMTDELLAAVAQGEEHAAALRALRLESYMAVPLLARGELLGALLFASSTPGRRYGPRDVRLAVDVAHRAALALDNARLYRAARQALRAHDEVLGVVAHDLRNPLNSIQLTARVLARRHRHDASVQDDVAAIARASERAERLIRDLLDVARMEAGRIPIERVALDARQIAAEAIESLKPAAVASSIEVALEAPEGVDPIHADRHRILQVFENLLGNAIKFTPRRGRVTVSVTPRAREVVFRVADTGPGIPAANLPHVFERFWQNQRVDRRGAGLGLAIARGIVEAHGGRIQAESEEGVGSTFSFSVPTLPDTPAG